jgi:hypothetical protein
MGMSGEQVAGCSQNTSILPTPLCRALPRTALQNPSDFLQHIQIYVPPPFTIFLVTSKHSPHFLRTSLVGSTTLSMTYGIKVQPYNDPYIKIAEEAIESIAELLIPGSFLVDIIPVLKYVTEWFPCARFQSKAVVMRKHAAIMRNATFAATEELMVCDLSPFSGSVLAYMYNFPVQR